MTIAPALNARTLARSGQQPVRLRKHCAAERNYDR